MIWESVALIKCTCLPSCTKKAGTGGKLNRKRGKLAVGEEHRHKGVGLHAGEHHIQSRRHIISHSWDIHGDSV